MNSFTSSFLLIVTVFCIFSVSAKGQGCCSGGAPLSGNLDLAPIEEGILSLRLIYDLNNLGSVVVGSESLDDRTRTRLTHAGLLRADYEFHHRWAISGLFTFVRQAEKVSFGSIQNLAYGQGLGDLVLIGRYNFLNDQDQTFSIGAGAKLPTGSISDINQETSLLLPPDLQPGTGAWDFIAISQFSKSHVFFLDLNFRSNVTFRYTTAAARFEQQQRYKFGNILQASAGFNYAFHFNNNSLLIPQANLRYRYSLADQTDGFETINTGGHWIYFVGGFEMVLNKKISFSVNTEAPIFWRLEGVQLTTSYKLTVGVTYNFYKEKASIF